MDLKDLYLNVKDYVGKEVNLSGWIRNHRKQKEFGFIDFSDGTVFKHIQIVYDNSLSDFDEIQKLHVGCAISVNGVLKESVGSGQDYEVVMKSFKLEGDCPEDYPIQPKRHSMEFLREQAYLRPRTNMFQAVFRVRSMAANAIHSYFQGHGYVYAHTPLITLPIVDGSVDMSQDLFKKQSYITGTGQLHGEAFAMAFKKIYTFGPTFRTENSNTKTHANEFWMIEPEIAFCDLNGLMDIEEDMLKYVVRYILDKCSDEVEFFDKFVSKGLKDKLEKLVNSEFKRITHHEAVDILKKASVKWEFEPSYDDDIAKEHERYITEYFNGPVFITDWPKDIKAWYMKLNSDDKTVAAVDLEVPGIGELIGGSQREENYDKLISRMNAMGVDQDTVYWYNNLRRFGGCYHSGFGLGFERLVMYLTGVENIRDVIPFPRTPGNCEF